MSINSCVVCCDSNICQNVELVARSVKSSSIKFSIAVLVDNIGELGDAENVGNQQD